MIAFAGQAEREFLAELREYGLVTPVVLEAMHQALGAVEAPSFETFLLAGADVIDERAWLSWLIRRHRCHRFGPVRWQACRMDREDEPPLNLPYRQLDSGVWLHAMLRPDQEVAGYRAAATLREVRQVRAEWRCGI